jgi:large subunit ribosomal protein L20
MPRATGIVASRRRRKKILSAARGYWGGKSKLLKTAKEAVEKGRVSAYRDRRAKKREYRKLWIIRINAAARMHGLNYSKFMHLLQANNIQLNRKVLSDIAASDAVAFSQIVQNIKK